MSFRWAVFGSGAIAGKFIAGLAAAKDAHAAVVASRSLANAQALATAFGVKRAVQGYGEALSAGGFDAVYIATPPSAHARLALDCIEAGVPVLIEKPFTPTAKEAREVFAAAERHGVFCMEAMWTRFLPAARALKALVDERKLGAISLLSGEFCNTNLPDVANGNFDPARGGGALAHLGVYPISLGQWLLGPAEVAHAAGRFGETGVEETAAFTLRYADGALGSFQTSLRAVGHNGFRVLGDHGAAAFRGPIFRPYALETSLRSPGRRTAADFGLKAKLRESGAAQRAHQLLDSVLGRGRQVAAHPYSGNGYHYEADEVRACVQTGRLQSDVMPWADSLSVCETTEAVRERIRTAAAA